MSFAERPWAVIAASPRPGGNSEAAALAFAQARSDSGRACDVFRLRSMPIEPCIDCGVCAKGLPCPFLVRDGSAPIFDALTHAPGVFMASPIYFYHLPARFKALIDRGQAAYAAQEQGRPLPLPRPAIVCLIAGRPTGDKLFEGALLTLKYFLRPFNLRIAETILLRGLDGPQDFVSAPEAVARVQAAALRAQF